MSNNKEQKGSSIFKVISVIFILFLILLTSSSFLLHEMNKRKQFELCQQMQDKGIAESNSCFFGETLNTKRTSGDTNYDGMSKKQFQQVLDAINEK